MERAGFHHHAGDGHICRNTGDAIVRAGHLHGARLRRSRDQERIA